ncbi:hypothetical protein I5M27_08390 [Adhaeribacter sp. BT258]|uniref:Reverse transcriptase domain-containing protein n=1 Tax=Adhaeribacter terrigena TaxID=2793070 RepID=A0ABS1C0Z0_9BACT|nr:reverse transcriptase domain-containing protein [Adhaeribacter terrigena]MBK0403004.1 hypothetical protein [Adhaeribacter terrigena]
MDSDSEECPSAQAPINFRNYLMMFTEELWTKWENKTEKKFEIKKYRHFDHPVNFLKSKDEIKSIVSSQAKVASHPFKPLVKILLKTPRYKYQDEIAGGPYLSAKERKKNYGLETKVRPISFASHMDRFIYGFYSFCLTEKYQNYIKSKGFGDCVYAYRNDLNEKCNIQFAKEVFDYIKNVGPCTAVALDVKGYFDSIDHLLLKEKWCKILGVKNNELPLDQYNIYRSLTRYSYVNNNTVLKHFNVNLEQYRKSTKKNPTLTDLIPGLNFKDKFEQIRSKNLIVQNNSHEELDYGFKRYYGIPQGSPISALLSNIFLIDFDQEIYELSQNENFFYRRYCDDLIIVVPDHKVKYYQKLLSDLIGKHHLKIQTKKTETIRFAKDSLGKLRGFDQDKLGRVIGFDETIKEADYFKNLQYLGFEFNGHKTFIRSTSLSRYFVKMHKRILKTVYMSYSDNAHGDKIFKKQLFERYSHLGKRNFLTYAINSSKKHYTNNKGDIKEGMDSPEIKGQISRHFDILLKELKTKTNQRIRVKARKKKLAKVRR